MKVAMTRVATLILAGATALVTSGCLMHEALYRTTGSGGELTADMLLAKCDTFTDDKAVTVTVSCPIGPTSSTIVFSGSIVDFTIWDPIILQLPVGTGFSSSFSYTVAGIAFPLPGGELSISKGLSSIPVDAHTTLSAEPGTELFIVDIPSGLGTVTGINFTIHWIDLGHSPVKVMLAAKVQARGNTYYAPLLPCTTSFADVPGIPTSSGLSMAQITALVAAMPTCNHKAYDLGGGAPPPPAAANYQGLWWTSPANSESGWGLNLAHQGDTIFASWFTYDMSGRDWWLVMTAPKTGPSTYSGKLYQTRGPSFNAASFDPATVVPTETGTGTLTFADNDNGSFSYTIGAIAQAKPITREQFGPLPSCTYAGSPQTSATNYQDLWWAKPAASESGWGINLNHEGDTIFATWFTYDLDNMPLWLVVTAPKVGPHVYAGDLYRTAGARFDAFDPAQVTNTMVGTAKFTFSDGANASFDYSVQLPGMAAPHASTKAITRELFSVSGTTCR